MKTIRVNVSPAYDVLLGSDLIKNTGAYIKDLAVGGKIAVITDDIVDKLYSSVVVQSLTANGYTVCKYVIKNGETSKTLDNFAKIQDFLCENMLQRTDSIVALGGGVVGDLAGFVAAAYLRGIKFVQIPTTLLSMIDSSVGGKTGVNLAGGKNLVGAFHQPSLVIADIDTLSTLPPEQIRNGKGEHIKHGILAGGELFSLIEADDMLSLRALELSIDYKRRIVEGDEKEASTRKLLNLGHTFGHAIEKLSNYTIPHGEAVAMGIEIIADAELRQGNLDADTHVKIMEILVKNDLMKTPPYNKMDIIAAALNDKKSDGDMITLVTIAGIGNCNLTKKPISELKEYLA
jgi:3-dehydroquinate synthase